MTERASRPLSQLGWAALGAIPMGISVEGFRIPYM
jgi:hypothetical protein